MVKLVRTVEAVIFYSRWLLAPLYLGLVAALFILALNFFKVFVLFVGNLMSANQNDVILGVLSLIDVVFTANLVLIVIFSGYENFVSQINTDDGQAELAAAVDVAGRFRRPQTEADHLDRRDLGGRGAQGVHEHRPLRHHQARLAGGHPHGVPRLDAGRRALRPPGRGLQSRERRPSEGDGGIRLPIGTPA